MAANDDHDGATAAPTAAAAATNLDTGGNTTAVAITILPPHVTNVVECIRHEIQTLESELERKMAPIGHGVGDDNETDIENELSALPDLEDALDDGFLCVDLAVLERKLRIWHELFTFPVLSDAADATGPGMVTVTPYYAIKCNPDPQVVHWLARTAALKGIAVGYDCASVAELELAQDQLPLLLQNGAPQHGQLQQQQVIIPATRVVYANPQRAEAALMKSLELFATDVVGGGVGLDVDEDVDRADGPTSSSSPSPVRQDLWLTLDGVEEVHKIHKALTDFGDRHGGTLVPPTVRLIIRIWVPDGHSQVPLGEKFGCPVDGVPVLVKACHEAGLASSIIGVSFHCGSGCGDVDTYREALAMAERALQRIDDEVEALLRRDEEEDNGARDCDHHNEDDDGGTTTTSSRQPCWLLDMGGGYPGWDGLGGDGGRFSGSRTQTTTVDENRDDSNDNGSSSKDGEASPSPSETTVATIADSIRPMLARLARRHASDGSGGPPMTLIAEPGRYFVEASAALASRIYQKQQVPYDDDAVVSGAAAIDGHGAATTTTAGTPAHRNVYRIAHGVEGVFKDVLLCGESFVPQPLQVMKHVGEGSSSSSNDSNLCPSRVLGPSGEVDDVVCQHCMLPDDLQVGDWLVFDRMGAYTMSIASRAGRPVVRYVLGGGTDQQG